MENKFELETIADRDILAVFQDKDGLDPIINQTREFVETFNHDLTTATGRARTASLSARVAKLKVRLDNAGKDLTTEWKQKASLVDATRKKMRDELDLLKVEARKPLTEWEEEDAKIKAEEAKRKAGEELSRQIENDHELALLLNEKVDAERQKLAEEKLRLAKEAEALAIELEKKRIAEQEESARIKAEQEAQAEIIRIKKEQEESEARQKAEVARIENEKREAERKTIEAEERAKIQAELAEQKRIEAEKLAKEQAERAEQKRLDDIEKAKAEEVARQKAEVARLQKEQELREANEKHTNKIKNEAYKCFVDNGVGTEAAKVIVSLIADGLIKHVKINF